MVRRTLFALSLSALGLAAPQAVEAQYGYSVGPVAYGNGSSYGGYGINAFNNRLANDPYLNAANLTAFLDDSTMYMRGNVPTLRARMRAQAIAESMYGYGNFVDETRVVPTRDVPDAELQGKIRDEIVAARLADELDVDVSIDDGVVTLESDRLSKKHEEMLVESIADLNGVRDVKVQIDGRPTKSYSDPGRDGGNGSGGKTGDPGPDGETLQARVRRSIEADARVPSGAVNASVDGDTALLSGEVGTLREKRAAVSAAYVPGIQDVQADNLRIANLGSGGSGSGERTAAKPAPQDTASAESSRRGDRPAADARSNTQERPGQSDANRGEQSDAPSDFEVRQRVVERVRSNPRLSGNDLQITVDNRVVKVEGTVDTVREEKELYNTVRLTRGVKDVSFDTNVLDVEDTPAQLQKRIENRLAQKGVDGITVRTARGNVNLEGEVPTEMAKRDAIDAVEDIPGVQSVVDTLTVPETEGGVDYYDDPAVDDMNAFDMLTNDLTEPGDGSATTFGGGAVVAGATDREVDLVTSIDIPDGVDEDGDAKRGKPLAAIGADDAPIAETSNADSDEEVADKSFEKVREAIESHPRLSEHDLTLKEVGEGRIVIAGAVDDWYEYSLIRSLAYDAGAKDVEMTVTVY